MELLNNFILKIEIGEMQVHSNMVVFPLFHPQKSITEYLTLGEALENKIIIVKEVDEAGSVPELKVINSGDKPVFMLDGEELVGAKQNRVLNTSVLLKEHSETVIPVSCTESGRWSFTSDSFNDSGVVMASTVRRSKNYSVSESLIHEKSFRSNQSMVWDEIDELAAKAEVYSETGAMHEVFEKRKKEIDGYVKEFDLVPHQRGLMVLINAKIIGFDIISLESAYSKLHQKLIKSYAVEAWLENKGRQKNRSKKGKTSPDKLIDKAMHFLSKIKDVDWKRFESIGYGWDYRHKGKDLVGSALVHNKEVIHMAFFNTTGINTDEDMASFRRRASLKIQPPLQ